MCFINFSNHASNNWGDDQKREAQKWGEIKDIPFPKVDPKAGKQEIQAIAEIYTAKILEYQPSAVMCQGEFTLTYHVVRLLKEHGITVVSACSERKAVEKKKEDGTVYKSAVFRFAQFREY